MRWLYLIFYLSGLCLACGVAAPPPAPEVTLSPDPSGSGRMARRLRQIVHDSPAMSNPFMNHRRVAYLRSLELPREPSEAMRHQVRLAEELLRAGESRQAAALCRDLLPRVEAAPALHPAGLARRLRSLLATAYLRLGEQENCLTGHNSDRCLLPIRGDGVHQRQEGSRQALRELGELLRQDGDDLRSRWLYNLAAMTLGEYPSAVPAAWRLPPQAFDSQDDIGRFADTAAAAGLDTMGLAGGSVVDDLDGDGDLDVMVSSWGLADPLRLYLNLGELYGEARFEEVSRTAGLDGLTGGLNLIHADYDNDGDLDILVLRGAWMRQFGRHPNSLLANDGQGRFDDVTEAAGLLSFHPTQTAAWADYDGDGWLDLFIGNESSPGEVHPCELYRNQGPGPDGTVTFAEVAAEAGVRAGGIVKGAVWGDIDNDGRPDLFLSRMRGGNLLFHNLGPGPAGRTTFTEVAATAGVREPWDAFPSWFFDYDNDGWLDLFVGGYARSFLDASAFQVVADYLGEATPEAYPRLYRNRGDGTFTDRTRAVGLDHALLAMGANFGDLDNDGWQDLYIGTGAPDFRALVPNRMFRNQAGKFLDITSSGGFGHLQKGHGISFADLDNDGDQDVLAVMGGAFSGDVYPNALFANPGHGHHWITLRLEGRRSNRSAIGARLRLTVTTPGGRRQIYATVSSGGSFGASSLQQEIGLGDATALDVLEVWWPGGERQLFHDLPLDRIFRLRQGDPEPVPESAPELRWPQMESKRLKD